MPERTNEVTPERVLAGVQAQLKRSSSFADTIDPVAALKTYGRLLDLVRTCCKGQSEPIADLCQKFNKATADGRKMQPYSDLLGKAIRSMIKVKEEKDIDSLFSDGKTTALAQTIRGLDDFELISFLVVQELA